MARLQRVYSQSGCYHIMLRGNERKIIFMDDEDRQKYLEIIKKKRTDTNLLIYAYCLMDNHIHMILRDDENEVSAIMQGIATSYAMYINKKYERVGHVFQGRFKSEAIENERYLMAAIRYVHNNPVKAGITEHPEQYEWSSYRDYIAQGGRDAIVDTDFILGMISADRISAIKEFERFSREYDDNMQIMAPDKMKISTLPEGRAYLQKYWEQNQIGIDLAEITANKSILNKTILELRTNTDLSIVKIAALLGVNRGIVQRIRP